MVEHVADGKTALDREESICYQSSLNNISARGLNSTLNRYQPTADKPWNKKRVAHLLKRTGYGAHIDRIDSLSQLTPSQAVDEIIQQSIDAPLPETPSWIDETPTYPFNGQYALANQERAREFKIAWTDEMRKAPPSRAPSFFLA